MPQPSAGTPEFSLQSAKPIESPTFTKDITAAGLRFKACQQTKGP
jgi:hypothetical protein